MSSAENEIGRSMASNVKTCSRSTFCQLEDNSLFADPERTVLHDIADDAKLIKVTASALSTEWFLECNLLFAVSNEYRSVKRRKYEPAHCRCDDGSTWH